MLSGLPNGYDTTLGKWFDDGEELSIGEWQKVALARAFLRDAQLIVLDEPTSALDANAEAEIFEKFYALAAHRAAVVVSHRLSTVKMADRIYVLSQGRIIEAGTHDELIEDDATYAKLFQRHRPVFTAPVGVPGPRDRNNSSGGSGHLSGRGGVTAPSLVRSAG